MKAICLSDIHGNDVKYRKLCTYIKQNLPDAVFIAGDVLPNYYITEPLEFIEDTLKPLLSELKDEINEQYPDIYLITGNDDAAVSCEHLRYLELKGLIHFSNKIVINQAGYTVFGYPYVPPTPFLLKDWEKYDISRYLPRDTVSPEDGIRTIEVPANIKKYNTIKDDLEELSEDVGDFSKTICLFHSPPVETNLDKIYGNGINGDKELLSVGSYAIRKFIEKNQPLVTIHGHIHESTDITGYWQDRIGRTVCFNAANSGSELALIEFDTENPGSAVRVLI